MLRNGSISPKTGEMRTSCSPVPTRAALVSPRSADPFAGGCGSAGPRLVCVFLFLFPPNFAAFVRSGSILFGTGFGGGGWAARSAQIGRTRQVVAMT